MCRTWFSRNELRGDAGLVKLLRNAGEQRPRRMDGLGLGRVGQYISNNTSFSPFHYGYKKLGDLFWIEMRNDNTVMFVTDIRK